MGAAYRNLMRAARIAFQGDTPVLTAAQSQIRNEFRSKSSLPESDRAAALQHAQDVARVLRENVVQGRQQQGSEHRYKLNIHEHTHRGDKESIKTAGKGGATGGGFARVRVEALDGRPCVI